MSSELSFTALPADGAFHHAAIPGLVWAFRIHPDGKPERFAAMVPATPDDST